MGTENLGKPHKEIMPTIANLLIDRPRGKILPRRARIEAPDFQSVNIASQVAVRIGGVPHGYAGRPDACYSMSHAARCSKRTVDEKMHPAESFVHERQTHPPPERNRHEL